MRIVGGARRGLALASPRPGSETTRPTSDRLRETIFNILAHRYEDPVPGARVLDLFAGTGALGLEALSRGAESVLFVENDRQAQDLIRRNIELFGAGATARLQPGDASRVGPLSGMAPFTLAFCDPPYRQGLGERALSACMRGGWLADAALVLVEEAVLARLTLPGGIRELDRRVYGETEIVVGRYGP